MFCTSKKDLAGTKGNIYKYLGLTINFSGRYDFNDLNKKRQVVFTMYNYTEDIIDSAPPDMRSTASDLAKSKLFTFYGISPRLGTVQVDFFHSMTAKASTT